MNLNVDRHPLPGENVTEKKEEERKGKIRENILYDMSLFQNPSPSLLLKKSSVTQLSSSETMDPPHFIPVSCTSPYVFLGCKPISHTHSHTHTLPHDPPTHHLPSTHNILSHLVNNLIVNMEFPMTRLFL